ncbi:MAG: imidazole glycerol phosphate synthase subunit HisH [Oscillospiraceae bacterium]|nr:imidazole glycerol phosphate synthase subunit HisH [Oscillospiraceae bacterium]
MVGIIDYGVGNLFSLQSSFKAIGVDAFVSGDAQVLAKADRLVLPGVGAFEDAAKKLRQSGLDSFVRQQAAEGKPLLGICLGMQLLFEKSFEYGEHEGLGLLKGQVVPMAGKLPSELKIPHMGWNRLEVKQGKLLQAVDGQYVYFVHSYYAENCADSLSAVSEYGIPITAAVEQGNIFGCQFHPEKSGNVGLSILKTFCEV